MSFITAGKFKGARLKRPMDRGVRATQQKVREAVFNIIGDRVDDGHFVDVCCGSGAMGLEALSRGAGHVTFIDIDIQLAKTNYKGLSGAPPVTILKGDAADCVRRITTPINGLFMDPPWEKHELYEAALKAIFESDILAPGAVLVIEHFKKNIMTDYLPSNMTHKLYKYGDTHLTVGIKG
ncbi:16S rRNA (guanine(966)-N(2))-methyltransferase RsmD [bacterium]|nr:16S rRNA (guanine(966)-N(2))-methyltransferase RsmD [bacterium]